MRTYSLFALVVIFLGCKNAQHLRHTLAEPHRPLYHFTPPTGWMNDPNGLVYVGGEYHLFYQHYPDSTVWGPMHWGHAVSRQLTDWQHLPIALYPDSLGLIFSGSAVVDWANTSGFGRNGRPPLVAIFTHHDMAGERSGRNDFQYQSIAYSLDNGRTWVKYAGNPVIGNPTSIRDFRDPKVLWHPESKQWVMALATGDHLRLYGSPNLREWQFLSEFGRELGEHGGVWECPDLFPIRVEGSADTKWVLLQNLNPGGPNGGSGVQYFVGHFDGKKFEVDPTFLPDVRGGKAVWLDHGRDNYAGVTWSDVPAADGRRIFIGWMSNWDYAQVVPTQRWRSALTLPRTLTLHRTASGYRLFSKPVREVDDLFEKKSTYQIVYQALSDQTLDLSAAKPPLMAARISFDLLIDEGQKTDFSVVLANAQGQEMRMGYDAAMRQWYTDRSRAGQSGFSPKFAPPRRTVAPRVATERVLHADIYLDRASCEVFADGGASVLTDIFFPDAPYTQLRLVAKNGQAEIRNFVVRGLR
jgi:fructan beta-fructosidase